MKSEELDLLLGAWPTARPTEGFSDRVLAACSAPLERPATIRRTRGRVASVFAVAALVAATVLVPLAIAHTVHSTPSPTLAAAPSDFDLGPQQD